MLLHLFITHLAYTEDVNDDHRCEYDQVILHCSLPVCLHHNVCLYGNCAVWNGQIWRESKQVRLSPLR